MCAADLLFPYLIYDMAQMTECVASSISRWHGCKAEYYLLSCSTHSDVRWMDDRRRVTRRLFFGGSHYQAVAVGLK